MMHGQKNIKLDLVSGAAEMCHSIIIWYLEATITRKSY